MCYTIQQYQQYQLPAYRMYVYLIFGHSICSKSIIFRTCYKVVRVIFRIFYIVILKNLLYNFLSRIVAMDTLQDSTRRMKTVLDNMFISNSSCSCNCINNLQYSELSQSSFVLSGLFVLDLALQKYLNHLEGLNHCLECHLGQLAYYLINYFVICSLVYMVV